MNIHPVRVLLIDDDEEDYILTRYIFDEFKDNQFTLDWRDNFDDAFAAFGENRHDIYLVDYRLGERTGLELLRAAIKAGCTAPIILLTGQGDKEIDFQAMQAGAADYLVKGELTAPLLERAIRYSLKHARSLEEIQNSEAKFRSVIQSASDAILLTNREGKITLWNKAAEMIFGYREEEIVGFPFTAIMGAKYANKALSVGLQFTLENVMPFDGKIIESMGRRKDGSEFPLELSGSVWRTSEGVYYTGILRDITERRAAESRLVHEATHDSLTGLPNRAHFTTILESVITGARGDENQKFAVLFLDLDRFKVINDGLGHVIGDKLLIAIAERLAAAVRPGDIVSRFGGDEFTILLNKIKDCDAVTEIAERLQSQLAEPFMIDSFEVFTSASIGIIMSEVAHDDPESFLRDADTAMYRAKEAGKARYEIFNRAMHVRNMNLLRMENDLRKSIERRDFKVFYQPIVNIETGKTNEFEAFDSLGTSRTRLYLADRIYSRRRGNRLDCAHRRMGPGRIGAADKHLGADVSRKTALGQRQPFRQAVDAPESHQTGQGNYEIGGSASRLPEARSNRIDGYGQRRGRARNSLGIMRARRAAQHRRFRDGLFFFELSPPVSVRAPENRPLVCR
jgi:diguanylate cyclase (GGDEF)-like protein/PAS domain S-box-containing protein